MVQAWKRLARGGKKKPAVQIITPYKAMVPLLKRAVAFLIELASLDLLNTGKVDACTGDSAQGTTYDNTVLAVPDQDEQWTGFLNNSPRILTS